MEYNEGLAKIQENATKIEELKKGKLTKRKRLAIYMLGGRPVTGATMINRFNILSYRDAIYNLKREGYEIKSKTIIKNGISHVIWWLSDFEENFILKREVKPW